MKNRHFSIKSIGIAFAVLSLIFSSKYTVRALKADNFNKEEYFELSESIILPENFDGSEESYNNLPKSEKDKLERLEELSSLAFDNLVEENIYLPRSFSNLSVGDILITKDNKTTGWRHGHAAMLLSADYIVEADGKKVTRRPYKWQNEYSTALALGVSSTSAQENRNAANWAYGKRDTPYLIHSNPDRTDRFYCSQLVYRSYLSSTKSRVKINNGKSKFILPMDLYYDSNTYVKAKKYVEMK